MRWIVLCFLVFSLRVFSGEPSEVALAFIRGLDGKVTRAQLSEELVISPFCGPEKRSRIDDFWKSRGDWSQLGRYEFSAIDERVDDDLAAVIIGARSPDGPDASSVLSLGLVRKDGGWKVAPVNASFENTGLGFGDGATSRARELERWMAIRRVDAINKLRISEMARFREQMSGAVSAAELAMEDPEEVLRNFIEAAEKKETEALIVWQGFLERDEVPERDWDQHMRATRAGMKGRDRQRIWRLMSSRQVMKVIMEEDVDTEEAEFMVGFLSSYETEPMDEKLNPVRFRLTRTGQGWRVRLPAYFSFADEDRRSFQTARNEELDWEDRRGVKRIFEVFEREHAQMKSDGPEKVMNAVIENLKKEELTSFLQRLHREKKEVKKAEDADGNEDAELLLPGGGNKRRWRPSDFDDRRMGRYKMAVKWWSGALGSRDTISAEVMKVYQEDKIALGILSLPTSGESWEPAYGKVWMSHETDGWVIIPGDDAPLQNSYPKEQQEVVRKITKQFSADQVKMKQDFLIDVLKVVRIEDPKGEVASEEQAKKLVAEWRRVANEGNMMSLLKVSAVRQLPSDPEEFLDDLGNVIKGVGSVSSPDQFLGFKAVGRFHGVSLMIDLRGGADVSCPLMIVVPTKEGHKVLVDIELPLETNGGLVILNRMRMEELAEELSKEDLASIKSLKEWHQEFSGAARDKWKLEQAASKE